MFLWYNVNCIWVFLVFSSDFARTHTDTHTLPNAVSFSMALGVIVSEQGEVHKRHSPEVTFPTIHWGLLNHNLACQQQGGRMDS